MFVVGLISFTTERHFYLKAFRKIGFISRRVELEKELYDVLKCLEKKTIMSRVQSSSICYLDITWIQKKRFIHVDTNGLLELLKLSGTDVKSI